jgi:hypothetical protein
MSFLADDGDKSHPSATRSSLVDQIRLWGIGLLLSIRFNYKSKFTLLHSEYLIRMSFLADDGERLIRPLPAALSSIRSDFGDRIVSYQFESIAKASAPSTF